MNTMDPNLIYKTQRIVTHANKVVVYDYIGFIDTSANNWPVVHLTVTTYYYGPTNQLTETSIKFYKFPEAAIAAMAIGSGNSPATFTKISK